MLLLAIGIPCSQLVSLAASHSQDHSTHCCGICHTGHLTLEVGGHVGFLPLSRLSWQDPAAEPTRAVEADVVPGHSRAPPA